MLYKIWVQYSPDTIWRLQNIFENEQDADAFAIKYWNNNKDYIFNIKVLCG